MNNQGYHKLGKIECTEIEDKTSYLIDQIPGQRSTSRLQNITIKGISHILTRIVPKTFWLTTALNIYSFLYFINQLIK